MTGEMNKVQYFVNKFPLLNRYGLQLMYSEVQISETADCFSFKTGNKKVRDFEKFKTTNGNVQ